jgi:RND family efflux transporter MFP subunit
MTKKLLLILLVIVGSVGIGIVASRWRSLMNVTVDASLATNPTAASGPEHTLGAEITVDARRQQLIGVRTVRAYRTTMAPEIRAVGTVAYDETRQAEINTRVDGWIRDLYADYTGRAIRRGEPLFTLYSPDLIATQNEYLLALRGQSHSEHGEAANLRQYSDRLVDAARERLLRLDMTAAEIEELQRTGRAMETLTFTSPAAGVIVEKAAIQGMRVTAGQALYRVADLSTVWIETEIVQTDLPRVRIGTRAVVSVQGYPEQSFRGRVSYVYPTVNEQTRTARVRVVLANHNQIFKPNMFTTVVLQPAGGSGLVLPADAVVNTGNRQVVFVAEGNGRFTPREVQVGRRGDNEVEVLSGLKEGDAVAAGATFFLDSESQLRSALRSYEAAEAIGPTSGASIDVTFRTEPDPPRVGEDTVIVTLKDANGQAIPDADVTVVLFMAAMPSMSMPAMRHEIRLLAVGGGVYRGTGQVMTPGRWDVTVTVSKSGKPLGVKQLALVAK